MENSSRPLLRGEEIRRANGHVMELMMRYPHLARRIVCMPTPIPDPFGGELAVYEDCLSEITRGVRELLFSGDAT